MDPNKTVFGFHSLFLVGFSLEHFCSSFSVGGIISKKTLVPAVCIGMNKVSSTSIINPFYFYYGLYQNGMPYHRIWFGLISKWSNLVPY